MKQKFFIALLALMLAGGLFGLGNLTSKAQDEVTMPADADCFWQGTESSLINTVGAYGLNGQVVSTNKGQSIEHTFVVFGATNASFQVLTVEEATDNPVITLACSSVRELNRLLVQYEDENFSFSSEATAELETTPEVTIVGEEPVFLIEGDVLSIRRCTGYIEEYLVEYVPLSGDSAYPGFTNTWILVKTESPARYVPLMTGYETPVVWDRQNEGEVMYVTALECD